MLVNIMCNCCHWSRLLGVRGLAQESQSLLDQDPSIAFLLKTSYTSFEKMLHTSLQKHLNVFLSTRDSSLFQDHYSKFMASINPSLNTFLSTLSLLRCHSEASPICNTYSASQTSVHIDHTLLLLFTFNEYLSSKVIDTLRHLNTGSSFDFLNQLDHVFIQKINRAYCDINDRNMFLVLTCSLKSMSLRLQQVSDNHRLYSQLSNSDRSFSFSIPNKPDANSIFGLTNSDLQSIDILDHDSQYSQPSSNGSKIYDTFSLIIPKQIIKNLCLSNDSFNELIPSSQNPGCLIT